MLRVQYGDLWEHHKPPNQVVVVTTNQVCTEKGLAVMGAGVALAAKSRFPHLPQHYGERIQAGDYYRYYPQEGLLLLPTKYHWRDPSPLNLILEGAKRLQQWIEKHPDIDQVTLPPLGCGNGGRNWREEVRPQLEQRLRDPRFLIALTEQQEPPIYYNSSKSTGYSWLSNFYFSSLEYESLTYPTSEHAYQAQKTLDQEWRRRIQQEPTPQGAKRLGREAPLRENWLEIRVSVMFQILKARYLQSSSLRKQLLLTYPAPLIHQAPWDEFWGNGRADHGQNQEGKLQEKVRDLLRQTPSVELLGKSDFNR